MRTFDAAGFDIVLIETVGAGQSEVDIARTAHTTLVVSAPGLGDDVQAIKAGILEIADILVVNKADHPGIENAVRSLRAMLDLGHRAERVIHHGKLIKLATMEMPLPDESTAWQPPIVQTIATGDTSTGIADLAQQIADHWTYLVDSGTFSRRERARLDAEITERLRDALLGQLLRRLDPESLAGVIERVLSRSLDPASAARALLIQFEDETSGSD